ncbi:MAG: hypothetical protein U9R79_16425 [Armatimonadota bacterium]|nr:hypothetical protein [Armatimonadota bacterium]
MRPAMIACPAFLAAVIVLSVATGAEAQGRILLEAEDLDPGGAWQVRPWREAYFCATFANDFFSRQAFLEAPAQCAGSVATGQIEVPATGRYALFARYACPYEHHVAFTVEMHQAGELVFRRRFGRLQSPKIWPFGGGVQPMASYSWGGGDNMVYEGGITQFRLDRGPATVSLIAGEQPRPSAKRQVDMLLLTPLDEEVAQRLEQWRYLPLDGLLTQRGDVFMRVSNPADGAAPMLVELTTTEHSPYWVHRRDWRRSMAVGARGEVEGERTEEDFMQPGGRSRWVEIGHRLDRLNESTLNVQVVYDSEDVTGADAIFEFAVPDAAGDLETVRRVRYTAPSVTRLRFAVPGDVRSGRIRTAEEDLEAILRYVRSLPDEGETPQHIGIRGVFASHFTGGNLSRRVQELVTELQQELIGDALQRGYQVESLGDEIHLRRAEPTDENNQAFREHLREQGISPQELLPPEALQQARAEGVEDLWPLVKLDYEAKQTAPRIWYHSMIFGYRNGSLLDLRAETERITRESDGEMRTGANYSPHPYYWPKHHQWMMPFRLGALTMPWSEDYVWGIPELSPQVTGYLLDVFRCGAKYHDLPICYYVMPHSPGNTPRSFRLSYYEALAHGAKLIHHFCVTPIVTAYTENYVSADYLPMYREIHDVAHELGQFDDILRGGSVRPASVALLISGTTDLWDPSLNYNCERKCLYYALRHAGIPVDFVTEEDIVEGRLADYRVLYISASHLLSGAANALREWVSGGGIVFSVAGGGVLDEYGETNATMLKLFGVDAAQLQEHDALPDIKHTLPRLRPVDGLRLELPGLRPVALPAIGTVQRLTAGEGARQVGRFHDGSCAGTLRELKEGAAVLVGGFPGVAYVTPAIPVRPWDRGTTVDAMCHFLPTDFDDAARDVILWPVREAGVEPDITLSEPIVEWSTVDSDAGTAILLVNWTGEPIPELTVTVTGTLGDRRVRSVEQGPLTPRSAEGGWQVTLPLGLTDCITVR